ncbi:hypothetical protein FACS1894182_03440 [Bacteroidia bacterium]|nr:hypothetical protein FACS1894182_03440 [Bacteroidia bacterium]
MNTNIQSITATPQQILILIDGLKRGVFNVDVFPEIGKMFENHKHFIRVVEQSDIVTYEIVLNRELKICILATLKNGAFPLNKALPTLEQEAKRNLFVEAMIESSWELDKV